MSNGKQGTGAYEVLKIDELVKVSDTQQMVRYYRHQIRTKGGVIVSVDIDEKDFTPQKAIPILTKKATEVDGIKSSRG